jgi:sarcosine oxidase subunit alpha
LAELFSVSINGSLIAIEPGTTVAAAMLRAAAPFRISVAGSPRSALCGMGICFECRAIVNGVPHRRTCQIVCTPGMVVETQL